MILNWDNCPETSCSPLVMSGAVVFKHSRVPISSLFENMADGVTINEFLEWFPGIKMEQVKAVLKFTAESLNAETAENAEKENAENLVPA